MSDPVWEVIADGGRVLPRRQGDASGGGTLAGGFAAALARAAEGGLIEASVTGEYALPAEGVFGASGWVRAKLLFSGTVKLKRTDRATGGALNVEISRTDIEVTHEVSASRDMFGEVLSVEGTVDTGEFVSAVLSRDRQKLRKSLAKALSLSAEWKIAEDVSVVFEPDEDLVLVAFELTPVSREAAFRFKARGIPFQVDIEMLKVSLKLGPGNRLIQAVATRVGPELVAWSAAGGTAGAVAAYAAIGFVGTMAMTRGLMSHIESQRAAGRDEAALTNFGGAYVRTVFAGDRRFPGDRGYPGVREGEFRAIADMGAHGVSRIRLLLMRYFNRGRSPASGGDVAGMALRMGGAMVNHHRHRRWDAGIESYSGHGGP